MPPFAPNGFASAGSGFGPATASRRPSSNATVNLAVDNMIRNQLKVSDVRDPKQIADALLNYYRDLPVAAAVRQEAQGLPFLQAPAMAALPPPQPTSSDAEFRIADGDVEKALTDLATNPLTNDIVPEMQGWADSIRGAVAQGYTAARQGLDPTQRDMVFAVRRQLGEYGRMARFVGSLSPGMTQNYRRLGQALDETSAVLLVMLGESLASVGFASGYYLLQVPLAELQQRRDAVIFALRNFMGGAQQAYGPDDWPRGIDAYRRLYRWLEQQGQGDLRSLLIENEIAQSMDSLISRAQNGTAEGLRALGVTAQLDIERFRRMAIVAPGALTREGRFYRSPPLEAFLEALELFADTFAPAGGLRLLRIARPPILFYGIYNPNLLEHDRDLVGLIMIRGTLATIFDSLFPASGARSVEPQVLLDMLLLELDRGIDLLSLGAEPGIDRPTEIRAIAYWLIVKVIRNLVNGQYINVALTDTENAPFGTISPFPPPVAGTSNVQLLDQTFLTFYNNVKPSNVWVYILPQNPTGQTAPTIFGGPYPVTPSGTPATQAMITVPAGNFLGLGTTTAPPSPWGGQVTLFYTTTAVLPGPIGETAGKEPWLVPVLSQIASTYHVATTALPALNRAFEQYSTLDATKVPPAHPPKDLKALEQAVVEELTVQFSLEERWRNLVRTVAPEAGNQESIFRLLRLVIEQANCDALQITNVKHPPPLFFEPRQLPRQFEESLDEIVHGQRRHHISQSI
jgi:hypothetical protein